jgi:hypothetical protein
MLLAISEEHSPMQQSSERQNNCFIVPELKNWKKEKPAVVNRGFG